MKMPTRIGDGMVLLAHRDLLSSGALRQGGVTRP